MLAPACLLAALALAAPAEPTLDLAAGTRARFASTDTAQKVLRAPDDFVRALSPFDRIARVGSEAPVDTAKFLEYVALQARPWSPAEMTTVGTALKGAAGRLAKLRLKLPAELVVIKTSGQEEGGSVYTRGTGALIVSAGRIPHATEAMFVAPLFHLALQADPKLREELYQLLGFKPCPGIALPDDVKDLRITNPDAPNADHCIELELGGKQHFFLPTLFASGPYRPKAARDFFEYLQFKLLAVSKSAKGWAVTRNEEGKYVMVPPEYVSSYQETVARNTGRPMHPEIILADNLEAALFARPVPDPELPAALLKKLARKP